MGDSEAKDLSSIESNAGLKKKREFLSTQDNNFKSVEAANSSDYESN